MPGFAAPRLAAETPGGGIEGVRPPGSSAHPLHRLWALGALGALELAAVSVWLDTGSVQGAGGLTALIASYGPDVLRVVVASAVAWLVFGDATPSNRPCDTTPPSTRPSVRWPLFVAHLGL